MGSYERSQDFWYQWDESIPWGGPVLGVGPENQNFSQWHVKKAVKGIFPGVFSVCLCVHLCSLLEKGLTS